jgi:hypothetical protein
MNDRLFDEPPIMRDVREVLVDPLSMLALVSSLLAVVDPRTANPFTRDRDVDRITRKQLIKSFAEVDRIETTALLTVAAVMTEETAERLDIEDVVAGRDHDLPDWLAGLPRAEAYRASEMTHVLGDGDNLIVGLRLPTGHELSIVLYVDHNLGTVAKDGFATADPVDELIAFMQSKTDDPDYRWTDIDRADARTRIEQAVRDGAITHPPFETDTWPAARLLVEWAARLLPAGGREYERPEWSDDARRELVERFLASAHAAGLRGRDVPDMLDNLLWFGCDYGPGDPMRWSPTAVEILLADWIPRKIMADAAYLKQAPRVLRAFVRFCHTERGIRTGLTDETLKAIDRWEPEYQATIRSPRPQGPFALLAAMGALDPEWSPALLGSEDFAALTRESLERAVGGPKQLAALTDDPLADEPFDWTDVPQDIRPAVGEVLALCDTCCATLLDTEYRTAARRFLAAVATGDPAVFRRAARAQTAAAAVCWIIGKANDLFTQSGDGLRAKDLVAHFGLPGGSPSQRAATLLRAAGLRDHTSGTIDLGSPRYLVSSRRRRIIERRDQAGG